MFVCHGLGGLLVKQVSRCNVSMKPKEQLMILGDLTIEQ
jgi:hypothetical protein